MSNLRIWKYPLIVTDNQTVQMPLGAKILNVQMQNGQCCLWAICDTNEPKELRKINIYGTGNPIPDDPGKYIATFQMYNGALVFHIFDNGWVE